jgi:hypothetical protein
MTDKSSRAKAKNKDVFIKVRCTADERAAWRAKAEGYDKSVSELMREAMGRVQPFTPANKLLVQERTRELAKIGNNINQLAHWANQHKSAAEAAHVIEALMLLKAQIEHSFPTAPIGDSKNAQ